MLLNYGINTMIKCNDPYNCLWKNSQKYTKYHNICLSHQKREGREGRGERGKQEGAKRKLLLTLLLSFFAISLPSFAIKLLKRAVYIIGSNSLSSYSLILTSHTLYSPKIAPIKVISDLQVIKSNGQFSVPLLFGNNITTSFKGCYHLMKY